MAEIEAIFDFDKTIVDCDSDNWVVDELGFTSRFDELRRSLPWNTMMDELMGEMHSSGIEIEQIAQVLRRIPIHPRVVPAIKTANALGCVLRIVSDANVFFIETILEHLGIKDLFSEINTNPGFVDERGRLRILPYHDFKTSPHGCERCPPNMCKGLIVERLQASVSGDEKTKKKKRFIYLGDGAGDYCPTLKLGAFDFVMPRKDFPVWDLMLRNPSLIKAEVHEWTDGQDQEIALLGIIRRILEEGEDTRSRSTYGQPNQLSSSAGLTDCKFLTLATSACHEVMPSVVRVPH